jgi:hypothetical protein
LYITTQIFTWYKNSEVKVKISPAYVKRRFIMAHGTIDQSLQLSPLQLSYCNCLLCCHCTCLHVVVVLGFWLQLLSSYIVIMDFCVVAAAAAFASVVVTVALFLFSSL